MSENQSGLEQLRSRLWASPYYLKRLEERGFFPSDLQQAEDCRKLPRFSRTDLHDHLESFLAPIKDSDSLGVGWVWSSGTSGRPMAIIRNHYDEFLRWTQFSIMARNFQVDLSRIRHAFFLCTLDSATEYQTQIAGREINRISALKPRWLERLRDLNPEIIFSNPAGVKLLRDQAEFLRPKIIFSTALPLDPSCKAAAEFKLQCPVVNVYSTTETGPIAWECPQNATSFHIIPEYYFAWSESDRPILTRFCESVLPLLNYELDDRARVVSGSCGCGFTGQSLDSLVGRTKTTACSTEL